MYILTPHSCQPTVFFTQITPSLEKRYPIIQFNTTKMRERGKANCVTLAIILSCKSFIIMTDGYFFSLCLIRCTLSKVTYTHSLSLFIYILVRQTEQQTKQPQAWAPQSEGINYVPHNTTSCSSRPTRLRAARRPVSSTSMRTGTTSRSPSHLTANPTWTAPSHSTAT